MAKLLTQIIAICIGSMTQWGNRLAEFCVEIVDSYIIHHGIDLTDDVSIATNLPHAPPSLVRQNAQIWRRTNTPNIDQPTFVKIDQINSQDIPRHFVTDEVHNCSICRADIEHNKVITQCFHAFHMHCLKSWLRRKRECPTCRTHV